ncbi:MAG TPA: hypothetical protein VGA69_01600 [Nitriliruptorales bacterium]
MDFTAITDGLNEAWTSVAAFTPKLLAALVILLIGWLVAKLVRTVAVRVLETVRFDDVLSRAGVKAAAERSGYDPKGLVAGVVYWILLFVTFQLTAETLGATQMAALLSGLIAFLPQVLVAVAIVVVALAFASFVAGAIRANLGERGQVGSRIAYWSIVAFGAVAALNQVSLAEETVNTIFIAAVATIGATVVVAFGGGGIPVAREVLDDWRDKRNGGELASTRAA